MAVVAEVSDVAHVPLFYNYFRFFNISHYFSEVSLQNLKKKMLCIRNPSVRVKGPLVKSKQDIINFPKRNC